jgi:hypothetical protein
MIERVIDRELRPEIQAIHQTLLQIADVADMVRDLAELQRKGPISPQKLNGIHARAVYVAHNLRQIASGNRTRR